MRVLHLLNELRASGAEVMLRGSARVWAELGVEAEILSTGRRPGPFAAELEAAGYLVHHLPAVGRPRYFRVLHRLIRAGAYDVVHVHPERAFFWHCLTARLAGRPTVVRTVHSVFSFTGPLRVERLVQRRLLRTLGVRTLSVSREVQRNEWRRFRHPTTWIPNWVDTASFAPTRAGERRSARRRLGIGDADRWVLVSVGNCGRAKNHEAILHALAGLGREPEWTYLHVGQEAPGRPERALARELGVAARCRFLGHVDDVAGVLAAADTFVMPSLHEGASIAALEALAAGVVCVLADSPGLRELRETVDEGIVWVDHDPRSVLTGLEAARDLRYPGDSARAERMHRAVACRYGMRRGVESYLAVYRGLPAPPGPTAGPGERPADGQ